MTVEATPAEGFAFADAQVVAYRFTFVTLDCPVEVAPASPDFRDHVCTGAHASEAATYTIPVTAHVTYTVGATSVRAGTYPATDGSTLVVRAVADTGFVLTGRSTFTHTFDMPHCPTLVSTKPVAFSNNLCGRRGLSGATFTIPARTGVSYTWRGKVLTAGVYQASDGSSVTIDAKAQDGYALTGTHRFTFRFLSTPPCVGLNEISTTKPAPPGPLTPASALASTGTPTAELLFGGLALVLTGALLLLGSSTRRSGGRSA